MQGIQPLEQATAGEAVNEKSADSTLFCQVDHETWYLSVSHYQRQQNAYLRDWHNHYAELQVKVGSVLEEFARAMAEKAAGLEAKDAQRHLCKQLHEKVHKVVCVMCWMVSVQVAKWRQEREQRIAAQTEQEAALHLRELAKREKEEEKRKLKKKRTKVKLDAYHKAKEQREAEQEAWLESLKEETEKLRREKAVEGQKRVHYRAQQHLNKLHRQKQELMERALEEEARERQLDVLRQQVGQYANTM